MTGINGFMKENIVALVESREHHIGTLKCLSLYSRYIRRKIQSSTLILIKPNFVSTYRELAATPLETVKAILDYISEFHDKEIIIAESPAIGSFDNGLKNFGYIQLRNQYNVEFIDLDEDDYEKFTVWDRNLNRRISVRVAKTILESDFIISPVRPKTHDMVIVTLSIKNVVMGAIQKGYKTLMHQGYKAININIAYLATYLTPSLSVIDGCVGMEGNGPVGGTPINSSFVLIGDNATTTDSFTSTLMGFDPYDIGYLYYLWKLGKGEIYASNVLVVGEENWRRFIKKYRPHITFRSQLDWRLDPKVEERILYEIKEEINTR